MPAAKPGPSEDVTVALCGQLARLTDRISGRLGDREAVTRFVMACVCTLFAEDVGACPRGLRDGLGGRWQRRPALFAAELAGHWQTLCAGGVVPAAVLRGCPVPALDAAELAALADAAGHDWTAVEPSILGTLLEQSLQARERSHLGAFFTPRAFIERLVVPTILEPLRDEWTGVLATARRATDLAEARGVCAGFLGRLGDVRVLDPACGTGNFLYVALDLLRGLEDEVLAALRTFAAEPARVVRPDQLVGIEKKRWSRDIAALVLWIGFVRRGWDGGPVPPGDLAVGDAVLQWDREEEVVDAGGAPVTAPRQGKRGGGGEGPPLRRYHAPGPVTWPAADFIVSNPPFLGNKRMRALLGDGYVEAVRAAYAEQGVAGDVDFVAYWWHIAATRLRDPTSRLRRFGLITTNSVRQRQTGAVLRRHLDDGFLCMHFACPDHPWGGSSADAAVRISMMVVRRADEAGARPPGLFNYEDGSVQRGRIHADLTVGADLARAVPLAANRGLCFQGMNLVGDGFRLTADEVDALVGGGARPAALRRYVMGRDLKRSGSTRYVIDLFGRDLEQARREAPQLLKRLEKIIKPMRERNGRGNYRDQWWLFGEARPGLRRALAGIQQYVATAETSRHRFFVMLDADVVPDHQLYAIASDDAYVLGVLSARPHVLWALHAGGRNGAGNDPRWTSTATFAPFPFPDATEGQRADIRGLARRLEQTRRDLLARDAGASLTDLYNDGATALLAVHAALDAAVLAAYGLPADVETAGLLRSLVALNHVRAAEEARGVIRWLRPEVQARFR